MDSSELGPLSEEFFDALFDFHPTEGAEAGLHAYDPLTGPRDAEAIARYVARLRELGRRLEAVNGETLGPDERLDRELILRRLHGELLWLDEAGVWHRDPRFYAAQLDLSLLILSQHAPPEDRLRSIVRRLESAPSLIEAARANVRNPPRPFVEAALVGYRGLPAFLRGSLSEALSPVGDPALRSRFEAARDAAAAAIEAYAAHLADEVLPGAGGEYALGSDLYRRMNVLLAGVDLPIARLEEIGWAEVERLQTLGESLADQVVPGGGLEAALRALGDDAPSPEAIVETAGRDIDGLVRFMEGEGLATLRPGSVEVRAIPAFRRTNFAYIMLPGPFEPENTGFYFIHPADESWSEEETRRFLRRHNRWTILNTSAHEAYPGHYHHFTHINRAPTKAQQLLWAYVTVEGWAHYSEEMAWRRGLADSSPHLGLAVVQDALLRAVRFLSSIGLHAQGMAVEESESLFRTIAFQDPFNARQQALRGTYDPEYLGYTLGKLMILQLREDLARVRGAKFDLRTFHDEFMARGAPPVPWIARHMLSEPGWQPFR